MDNATYQQLLQLLEPEACAELQGTRLDTLLAGGKLQLHPGGQDLDFAADAEKIAFALALLKLFSPAVSWFFDQLKNHPTKSRRSVHDTLKKAFRSDKNIERILDSRQGRVLTAYLQGMEDARLKK